jgi:hypothetical protein
MLKFNEETRKELQDNRGFWTEKYEYGFWCWINKNNEIEYCNQIEVRKLQDLNYTPIFIKAEELPEEVEELEEILTEQFQSKGEC